MDFKENYDLLCCTDYSRY
ncbi:hypothetical protein OIU79_030760, partial [Salix purpurea]